MFSWRYLPPLITLVYTPLPLNLYIYLFILYILNSKRNANVCSDPVQSHYDEKLIHDNRSTSQNEIRAKCSLDICLSNCTVWYSLYTFLHTPPVSKTANVKTWLTFIQSNIANLTCVSFAVQYINNGYWPYVLNLAGSSSIAKWDEYKQSRVLYNSV